MGFLSVTSEMGMFHSACLFETSGRQQWRGYHPSTHRSPVALAEIDRSNRDALVNHYIRFSIDDKVLDAALTGAERMYEGTEYILGVRDCVSFSADVVRMCGLAVPRVNMTPFGLVQILRVNDYTELDIKPYPWR